MKALSWRDPLEGLISPSLDKVVYKRTLTIHLTRREGARSCGGIMHKCNMLKLGFWWDLVGLKVGFGQIEGFEFAGTRNRRLPPPPNWLPIPG